MLSLYIFFLAFRNISSIFFSKVGEYFKILLAFSFFCVIMCFVKRITLQYILFTYNPLLIIYTPLRSERFPPFASNFL